MAPRLLLHIGTEKTGTTAWQAWLASQRGALDRNRFAVPQSLGPTNHRKLPTSCFDLDRVDDFVIRSGLECRHTCSAASGLWGVAASVRC